MYKCVCDLTSLCLFLRCQIASDSDSRPPRRHAVRVVLFHDRFFRLEEKFYCDKPTEKTVKLQVFAPTTGSVFKATPKITCQYPIVNITDLSIISQNNLDLQLHSPFTVLQEPTDE